MEAILSFPISDVITTDNSFEIRGFEKSFWSGNKQKAYAKVSLIEDHRLAVTVKAGTDNLPDNYDVALGFMFNSVYGSYRTDDGFFMLGEPRKIILSYYWLMEFVNAKLELYGESQIDAVSAIISGQMQSSLNNMSKSLRLMRVKSLITSLQFEVTKNER
jgi:hypothetical protein